MFKPRIIRKIFLAASFFTALSATVPPAAMAAPTVEQYPADTTMGKIQKRGKLIVGVKVDFPLFGLRNPVTGKLEGMDIDLAQGIATDLLGNPDAIQYVEVNSGNREVFLQQGKVDMIIATYPPNPAREKSVDFAGPYVMSPIGTMVSINNQTIHNIDDMNGKTICVTKGSGSETYVPLNAPKAKLLVLGTMTQCMQAVLEHRADGVTTTQSILLGQMSQNPGKFKLVDTELVNQSGKKASDNDSIGIPKGDKALHDYLDAYLRRIFTNGEWKKMYDRTIGTVLPGNVEPPPILY